MIRYFKTVGWYATKQKIKFNLGLLPKFQTVKGINFTYLGLSIDWVKKRTKGVKFPCDCKIVGIGNSGQPVVELPNGAIFSIVYLKV